MEILHAVPYQRLTAGAEGRCGAFTSGGGQVAIAAGLISIPAVSTSRAPAVGALGSVPSAHLQQSAGGAGRVQSAGEGLEGHGSGTYLGVSLMRRDERTSSVSLSCHPACLTDSLFSLKKKSKPETMACLAGQMRSSGHSFLP